MLKKITLIFLIVTSLVYAQTKKQPVFNLKTINGKTIEIKGTKNGLDIPNAKGKIIFLEFWGTHCPPCLFSVNHYIELTKKYKDKLEMLAIEVQMTPKEQLRLFAKNKGINYKLFTQAENMDFVRYLAIRAGWRNAIPFLVVFDTKGNVVDIQRGMVSKEYLEKLITSILEYNKNDIKETNSTKSNKNETNTTTKDNNKSK